MRLESGLKVGIYGTSQYDMLKQCCGVILECMDKLDADPKYNLGLVHTDIRNTNFIYTQNRVVLIDFSRSVYSYYLYDLGELCLHGDFCGSSAELKNAALRGYHSVKPLKQDHPFMMQAFFAMFIMMVIAEGIENTQPSHKAWLGHVLKWFHDEVHPGLISGKGYLDSTIFSCIDLID